MKLKNLVAAALIGTLAFGAAIALTGCGADNEPTGEVTTVNTITAEQGKAMLDEDSTIILVDVRTTEEFQEEHIPGAILVPIDELETLAPEMMPDKEATYIVYCRSGNRSATAAQQLVDWGYKNIYDMGGIIDWPYETVLPS